MTIYCNIVSHMQYKLYIENSQRMPPVSISRLQFSKSFWGGMPPDPPRLGVLRTPSLSTFINHHASKGPLLVKKNHPFKIPGYGPVLVTGKGWLELKNCQSYNGNGLLTCKYA